MMMRGRYVGRVAELALALLGPAREQVALEYARELELPRRGLLEPLLGAGVGLDLGHTRGCVLCLRRRGLTRVSCSFAIRDWWRSNLASRSSGSPGQCRRNHSRLSRQMPCRSRMRPVA